MDRLEGSTSSPIKWVGSKRLLRRRICQLIPTGHEIYVELFAGSAAVFFFKKMSKLEVLNDIDPLLMTFYHVIQDPGLFSQFLECLDCSLIARDLFMEYRASNWKALDPVEVAFRVYYIVKTSYGGLFRFNQDGMCNSPIASTADKKARSFLFKREPLVAAHRRLNGVILHQLDYKDVITKYDSLTTFFYIDPPYETDYAYNKPFDHEELAEICNTIKGKFVLSLNAGFKEYFSRFAIETVKVNYSVTCKPGDNAWAEIIVNNFL
nr:Dam family site-specific DNA-(adenine-N6)-methyltransferase [Candidatus Sigynarchaeota archaeon]